MKKLMLIGLLLFTSACTVIGPGSRGVRYNFGSLSSDLLEPGLHLWIPFIAGAEEMNVQIQKVDVETSAGTKDQQELNTKITVNIQLDSSKVLEMVKTVGGESAVLARVLPLVQEAINSSVSKYSAEEVLTKRTDLKKDIETLAKERVAKYGVILHDISITDLQYSTEYAQAIEKKQIAEQRAKQAEYETLQAEQTAKAAVAKAKGEAESNNLKQKTLTPQLIQYEAIQRWDGKLPSVNGGGNMPFLINLGK